ncbi:type V toxin-antitoxin system endoribonuclease antitoxin GhoS [Serratia nevei]|uniref:type V toxin-antitoxin system endoribonuclease antitoxin GhoS n=1 Tax=Serratia nevei TaxID=2703794 RepID=UPI0029E9D88E|nr:type V toxin-antitoxin system endoribonuclease antitoxin GhoS [Serratia marcescens]
MAMFTVRVELHNADSDDYENLHQQMEAAGFSRTITTTSGEVFHLPNAEYSYTGNKTTEDVRDLARDTAKRVKAKPAILVTKSDGSRRWSGLDQD